MVHAVAAVVAGVLVVRWDATHPVAVFFAGTAVLLPGLLLLLMLSLWLPCCTWSYLLDDV